MRQGPQHAASRWVMTALEVELYEAFLPQPGPAFATAVTETGWDDRIAARRTASFGEPYDDSGLVYAPAPWPSWLGEIRARVAAQLGHPVTSCLANLCPDGRSRMGFHADSYENLVPSSAIAIVSLGTARTLRFRREPDRKSVVDFRLSGGSLLVMRPAVQRAWKHAVPVEEGAGPRVSLTFRCVRPSSSTPRPPTPLTESSSTG